MWAAESGQRMKETVCRTDCDQKIRMKMMPAVAYGTYSSDRPWPGKTLVARAARAKPSTMLISVISIPMAMSLRSILDDLDMNMLVRYHRHPQHCLGYRVWYSTHRSYTGSKTLRKGTISPERRPSPA